MKLIEALRLNKNARLAFVGAGGKTSCLFRLGRELIQGNELESQSVWLSATTHLSTDQLRHANRHVEIKGAFDFTEFLEHHSGGTTLFTGPPVGNERTAGVSFSILEEVKTIADRLKIPLILEADGAKRLPIKAPAAHEPVIPDWIEQVVVVAGLSVLGKPLTEEWVHRPELFANISGLTLGDIVTPEALVTVLGSQSGGLKGIPNKARRILLLNQAVSLEQQEAGQWIAAQLQNRYHGVILAELKPPIGEGEILAVYEHVAGVVLAAGGSSRLGAPKQLLEWRGKPLVNHVARLGTQAGLSPIFVVTGHAGEAVSKAVEGLPVKIIENNNWRSGQSTSIAAAMQSLPDEVGAVIFLLSDQPLIPVDLVRELVALHAKSLAPIVAPLINGQRSSPGLFDRKLFFELRQLSGDQGGRVLFSQYSVSWLEWNQEGINLDIDTYQDYQRLIEMDEY